MSTNIEKREKLYRAWDKFQKKMIGLDYNKENIGLLPSCDKTGCTMYHSNGNITLINVGNIDYDIMEFIGQHDINNKRLYEFDIVRWREKFGEKSDLIIRNDYILGLIVWSREICGFAIEQMTEGKFVNKIDETEFEYDSEFYNQDGEKFIWEDLEVVGNKYQTPNLLENSLLRKD